MVNEGRHMTLLEADINMDWKASSVNTGVDDYAAMNTFCTSSSGFGCSTRIAANNFGYNVQVGGCIFPVDRYYHPSRWGGCIFPFDKCYHSSFHF